VHHIAGEAKRAATTKGLEMLMGDFALPDKTAHLR